MIEKEWGYQGLVGCDMVDDGECLVEGHFIKGQCSKHYHESCWNQFIVLKGQIVVHYMDEDKEIHRPLRAGQKFTVRPRVVHWFEVIKPGWMIERYWREDGVQADPVNDIVRVG